MYPKFNAMSTILRAPDDGGAGGGEGGDNGGGEPGAGGGDKGGALPQGAFYSDARFRDALPDELKSHQGFEKVTSLEHLARGYLSSQKLIGKPVEKLLEIPDQLTPETRAPILKRLGLPDDATGYKLEAPEGVGEGFKPDGPLAKVFIDAAHKAGVLPDQAQGVYAAVVGSMNEFQKNQIADAEAQDEKNGQSLKAEWGGAYDAKMNAANFAADQLGIREAIEGAGLGLDLSILKGLARVGEMLAEDGSETGSGAGAGNASGQTPEQLRSRAKAIMNEALSEKNPQKKRELSAEAQRLLSLANPKIIA